MKAKLKQTLRGIRDNFLPKHPNVLVVGAPRTGFTLLISVLTRVLARKRFRPDPLRAALREYVPIASENLFRSVEHYCREYYPADDLIISPEFKLLVGGPKWISKTDPELACVRKYVGVRGVGDFLAILSLPRAVLHHDDVIHCHYQPDRWADDARYADHQRFGSFRNPLDTLNSASFSINALTGEYIDRYVEEDSDAIRDRLALWKLSNLDFVEGLIVPQVEYWKAFLQVRDRYTLMRWEDLITSPVETIGSLSRSLGLPVSPAVAREIWDEMKYANQTVHHRHNFRKGVIGDWKNHLVNEHLELLKERGFDEFLRPLGYAPIELLDREQYTPFQRKVEACIRAGKPYEWEGDENVRTFAFNKSNFKSTKFEFIGIPGQRGVDIERSSLKNEAFLKGFMRTCEDALAPIRTRLDELIAQAVE